MPAAVLTAMAVVVTPAGERSRLLPLLALPLLLTAFHQLFHAKDRFHVPLAPAFALLAAVTLDRTWAWIGKARIACQSG